MIFKFRGVQLSITYQASIVSLAKKPQLGLVVR